MRVSLHSRFYSNIKQNWLKLYILCSAGAALWLENGLFEKWKWTEQELERGRRGEEEVEGGGDNWPKAPSAPVFLTILGSWSDFPSLGIDCLLALQILKKFPINIVGRVIANKMLCIYTMRSAAKCYLCILVIGPLRWSTLSKCYVPGWLVPLPW